MNIVKCDPLLNKEFCYLNKRSHPYDWVVVDFKNRNGKNYLTVSSRGITQYNDGDMRFLSIEDWEREVKQFNKIREIRFFKTYKSWKYFSIWKKFMRRQIMEQCSKKIEKKLFYLDDKLRQPLIDIKTQTLNLCQQKFLEENQF